MTTTTDMSQSRQRKKHWIYIIILLVFVFLSGSRVIHTNRSSASIHQNMLVEAVLSSTATLKATSASEPTATTTPKLSSTATPTPTRLSTTTTTPTLASTITPTPTPSSTRPTTIWVSGHSVNLRTGPRINFSSIRKLAYDEELLLLGRSSDNSWLFVQTSAGEEGWIIMSWVDLTGVNFYQDDYPVTTPSPAPPVTIWVSGGRVNLRTGPGTNYSVIRKLTYKEQLLFLGRLSDNSWLFVQTSAGEEGWVIMSSVDLTWVNLYHNDYPFRVAPPTETSTPVVLDGIEGHWIDVDLSEQMLRAYDGVNLVASFLVSTGIYLYPTETGQYHIYTKYLSSPMRGDDYYLPDVPYSMYYSGDFSIHGTYWHHNFGTPMSHGCINMDINDAEWLYHWSSIGTLVNIHR